MEYRFIIEHLGHQLKVVQFSATATQAAKARIICETCGTTLVEAFEPHSKPFKPFPKSDTQGGKVR
jgi:hypothetical protein